MKLWIVGFVPEPCNPKEWSLIGAFSTRELAVAQCLDCRYHVGAVELDRPLEDQGPCQKVPEECRPKSETCFRNPGGECPHRVPIYLPMPG